MSLGATLDGAGRSKRVVHISTVHRTFDVRIFHKEAVSLAASGYETFLIVRASRPETIKGVRILALPPSPNRLHRATLSVFRAMRLALAQRADIYHLNDPELIWAGLILRILGKKVVYDAHETISLSKDRPISEWAKKPLAFGLAMAEALADRFFNAIVAATPSIVAAFKHNKRVRLVRNTARTEDFTGAGGVPFRDRPSMLIYAGGLLPYNGVGQMIEAMSKLPPAVPARLLMAGQFASDDAGKAALSKPGSERVDFVGWMDKEALGEGLQSARGGLVVYQPTPNVLAADPVKFYELMGAGLPVIASDIPRWRDIIIDNRCGIVVDPQDTDAIARAIETLMTNPEEAEAMGMRGREAALQKYNWGIDERALLALYDELIGPPVPSAPAAQVGPQLDTVAAGERPQTQ